MALKYVYEHIRVGFQLQSANFFLLLSLEFIKLKRSAVPVSNTSVVC